LEGVPKLGVNFRVHVVGIVFACRSLGAGRFRPFEAVPGWVAFARFGVCGAFLSGGGRTGRGGCFARAGAGCCVVTVLVWIAGSSSLERRL
jgi:hypothetical protein